MAVKEVMQFCVAVFELNWRSLPTSKAGPTAVVLVQAEEWGPLDMDSWEREGPDESVEGVCSMSEDSASLVGAAGGTGVEHDGQLHCARRQ